MIVHDIARIIPDEITTWPGDPEPLLSRRSDIAAGASYTLHMMSCSAHCGTHLDAPAHFIADGGDILSVALDSILGDADVIAVASSGSVDRDELVRACPCPAPRVLLRPCDPYADIWLGEDAAHWLVEQGVRLVGTPCMSIDAPDSSDWPVHRALLSRSCSILENCKLDLIAPGRYFLVCTPLPWRGAEASPVRAVLIEW